MTLGVFPLTDVGVEKCFERIVAAVVLLVLREILVSLVSFCLVLVLFGLAHHISRCINMMLRLEIMSYRTGPLPNFNTV